MPVGETQRLILRPSLSNRFPSQSKVTLERNDLANTPKRGLSGITCTMHSRTQLRTPRPTFPLPSTVDFWRPDSNHSPMMEGATLVSNILAGTLCLLVARAVMGLE